VLAAGLLLISLGIAAVLSHAPQTLAKTNGVPLATKLGGSRRDAVACQAGEAPPRDAASVRLGLFSMLGPKIALELRAGNRLLATGTRGAGWDGTDVSVPLRWLSPTASPVAASPVAICLRLDAVDSEVSFLGADSSREQALHAQGATLPGRMRIEYLRSGGAPWWSRMGTVVRNLGFGHALSGGVNALIAILLATSVIVVSSWLLLRELP